MNAPQIQIRLHLLVRAAPAAVVADSGHYDIDVGGVNAAFVQRHCLQEGITCPAGCRYESCAPYAVQGGKGLLRDRVDGILRPVHPLRGGLEGIAGRKENRQKQY